MSIIYRYSIAILFAPLLGCLSHDPYGEEYTLCLNQDLSITDVGREVEMFATTVGLKYELQEPGFRDLDVETGELPQNWYLAYLLDTNDRGVLSVHNLGISQYEVAITIFDQNAPDNREALVQASISFFEQFGSLIYFGRGGQRVSGVCDAGAGE